MRPRGALALGLAVLLTAACSSGKLVGEPLPSQIAPDFTLTDGPTGQVITLSSLKGQVVLLTFLYTRCPDACPLTAETIRAARGALARVADVQRRPGRRRHRRPALGRDLSHRQERARPHPAA